MHMWKMTGVACANLVSLQMRGTPCLSCQTAAVLTSCVNSNFRDSSLWPYNAMLMRTVGADLHEQEALEGIQLGSRASREGGLRGRAVGPGTPQLGFIDAAVSQQWAAMSGKSSPGSRHLFSHPCGPASLPGACETHPACNGCCHNVQHQSST